MKFSMHKKRFINQKQKQKLVEHNVLDCSIDAFNDKMLLFLFVCSSCVVGLFYDSRHKANTEKQNLYTWIKQ